MNKRTLALYHKVHCPYCRNVLSLFKNSTLKIALKDTDKVSAYQQELIKHGGKKQVPCLKVSEKGKKDIWLYESTDIIKYLNKIA